MNKYWILLFSSVIVASFSQILLKKGASKKYSSVIREYLNPWVVIGYAFMVGSTILTVFAYKGLAYQNGPIIESLGYILVMLLCGLFLKEKITKRKIFGNILIIVGIVVFYL